jgi:hypothetical protein
MLTDRGDRVWRSGGSRRSTLRPVGRYSFLRARDSEERVGIKPCLCP